MAVLNQKRKLATNKQIGITGCVLLLTGILLFLLKRHFPFFYIFYYNLAGIGIALCIWYIQKSRLSKHRFSKVVVFISKISYSIYLVNLITIYVLLYFFQGVINNYFLLLSGLVLITSLSYLTYRFVELPFLRFRDKYFPERENGNYVLLRKWNLILVNLFKFNIILVLMKSLKLLSISFAPYGGIYNHIVKRAT